MKRWLWLAVGAVVLAALGTGLGLAVYEANKPEMVAHGRTSQESQRLNDAYLNYVRMNNPELQSEPNGNLLLVGYKVCTNLHSYSETTLTNMAEIQYPGAGRRIYDGATQYLCEEGR
jgi:hypothetical protein